MEAKHGRSWNEEAKKATFEVTPDDVVLLAAKAGVALNRHAALEYLRGNSARLERVIDDHILFDFTMDRLDQEGNVDNGPDSF